MALLTLCDVNATLPLVMSRRVGQIGVDDGRFMIRRMMSAVVQLVLIGPLDKAGRTVQIAYVSIMAGMRALIRGARWSGGLLVPVQPICLCFRP